MPDNVAELYNALDYAAQQEVCDFILFLIQKKESQAGCTERANPLIETDSDFASRLESGYKDMQEGRVVSLEDAFSGIKRQLA